MYTEDSWCGSKSNLFYFPRQGSLSVFVVQNLHTGAQGLQGPLVELKEQPGNVIDSGGPVWG